jgi:hypothetical protein
MTSPLHPSSLPPPLAQQSRHRQLLLSARERLQRRPMSPKENHCCLPVQLEAVASAAAAVVS